MKSCSPTARLLCAGPTRSFKSLDVVARRSQGAHHLVVAGLVGAILWSRRPELRDVPRVEQMTLEAATQAIEAERLAVATDAAVYDEKVPAGRVISQDPAPPLRLKKGARVTLTLSKGREPVTVPSLEGLTLDQATAVLRSANLALTSPARIEPSEIVPEGTVISWTPRGAQPPGTAITLVISSGPPTVVLPKVNGLSPKDARAALPPKLDVTVVEMFADNTPKGLVVGTSPKSGTEVAADCICLPALSIAPWARPRLC